MGKISIATTGKLSIASADKDKDTVPSFSGLLKKFTQAVTSLPESQNLSPDALS